PTTYNQLQQISLGVSIGAPLLLQGPPGSGKTALVEGLAHRTGHHLVKIHMGDETDARVLLGAYVATSEPGQFRWQPGVLTVAVQEGRWVLLEDVDSTGGEVQSLLAPLVEQGQLSIPGRGEVIRAAAGFRLFATMATLSRG
ncbi:P-loop containing nucleoside triphosphate hydrolase protein, partial [Piptocephalis cylindrospora]